MAEFEFARRWWLASGPREPAADRAVHESSLRYATLLSSDQHHTELNQFLQRCCSSLEEEVGRAIGIRDTPCGSYTLRHDEAVREVFRGWFLRRYDLLSATKLSGLTESRYVASIVAILSLLAVSVWLFVDTIYAGLSNSAGMLPPSGGSVYDSPGFLAMLQSLDQAVEFDRLIETWKLQVFFQFAVLLVLAFTPKLFRVLLPRAIFGALLAWLTVILAGLPDILQIQLSRSPGVRSVQDAAHEALRTGAIDIYVFGLLPACLISFIFILLEVQMYVRLPAQVLARSFVAWVVVMVDAMFWSLIFGVLVKWMLEKELDPDCSCLLPIVLIGTAISGLFGILVQLLWDDRQITEELN